MNKITSFPQVPEVYYLKSGVYRGVPDYEEAVKPRNPRELPKVIYLFERENGETEGEYVAYEIKLSEKEILQHSANSLTPKENSLSRKKKKLLNIKGINFHFLDFAAIRYDYERRTEQNKSLKLNYDVIVRKLTTEVSTQTSGGINVQLPKIVEGFFKDEKNAKTISEFEFRLLNPEDMFIDYQRRRIEDESVVLNLELKEAKSKELLEFEETISTLRNKYKLEIDKVEVEKRSRRLEAAILDDIITELEDREDKNLIVYADFTIHNLNENYYELSYIHPLNQNIKLVVRIQKTKLGKDWNERYELQTIDKGQFSLYVYGSVLSTKTISADQKKLIQIYPIAIYTL